LLLFSGAIESSAVVVCALFTISSAENVSIY
jgi:hypothetical protein